MIKHRGRKKKNIPIDYFVEAVYGVKAKEVKNDTRSISGILLCK